LNPLVVSNLSHSFGGVRALDGVSLHLQAGERRAIIGTNGAGKTTLFNVINGQIAPSAGEIWIRGTDATRLPVHRRAALGLARTFQVTSLFPHLSVLHNMIVAVAALSRFHFVFWRPVTAQSEIIARAQDMLAGWNLWDYRDEVVANLSYGVQRQLEIVLSASETHLASDIILNLDRAITVLLIEHDLAAAFRIADRVTAMDQGRVVAEGTPDEIRKESSLKRIYMGAGAAAPKDGASRG